MIRAKSKNFVGLDYTNVKCTTKIMVELAHVFASLFKERWLHAINQIKSQRARQIPDEIYSFNTLENCLFYFAQR